MEKDLGFWGVCGGRCCSAPYGQPLAVVQLGRSYSVVARGREGPLTKKETPAVQACRAASAQELEAQESDVEASGRSLRPSTARSSPLGDQCTARSCSAGEGARGRETCSGSGMEEARRRVAGPLVRSRLNRDGAGLAGPGGRPGYERQR
ncbi:hypothetical protein NDU88_000670 [Pleurodeles waltl]|uniref:Uncharacterized protein n=1 Tax=Pleurodeles waltl TaxID=8319 RepID=A0AAV7V7E2_PLEWA|nr:hypothetical protein NDU88_000670 [Pleurodeles waltl]